MAEVSSKVGGIAPPRRTRWRPSNRKCLAHFTRDECRAAHYRSIVTAREIGRAAIAGPTSSPGSQAAARHPPVTGRAGPDSRRSFTVTLARDGSLLASVRFPENDRSTRWRGK